MKKRILLCAMCILGLSFVYSQAGQLDPSFGNNGLVKTDIPVSTRPVFQKDGKIVLGGSVWNGKNYDFAITRYNTDGTLDKTFSDDGRQTTDFSSKNDNAVSVAIQNDGKIVVCGNTVNNESENGASSSDSTVFSIARYNTDGSLDNTFSVDGKVQTDFFNNGRNEAKSVVIQSDGKILLVGRANRAIKNRPYIEGNSVIVRYNSNGSLDKTYNGNGKQTILFNFYSDEGGNDLEPDGSVISAVIQPDNKVVVSGQIPGDGNEVAALARVNTDGSLDNTFGRLGTQNIFGDIEGDESFKIAIQNDGKLLISGFSYYRGDTYDIIKRLNIDGSADIDISIEHVYSIYDGIPPHSNFIAGQPNGKVVSGGVNLHVYNADGSFDSTFMGNGKPPIFGDVAINGDKLYAVLGNNELARYFLDNNQSTPPTVTLTTPANNTTRLAPAAHIKLSATAADKDGTISKVEFYNGTHLLHTETVIPYGFVWRNVPLGNYTLTAKAYDNSGLVTTSAPVHISVVPNKPPVVSIVTPANNQVFAASADINIEADARDVDGRMARVEFYDGSTLLNTQYQLPYGFVWKNASAGTHTITAVARDNWGARTTSAPVTFNVTSNTTIVSNRASVNQTGKAEQLSISLAPNPANSILNLYMTGLQQNKPATIRILSTSGVIIKTMRSNSSAKNVQLDVSSLVKGVYTIQFLSGDKILYGQFVKL